MGTWQPERILLQAANLTYFAQRQMPLCYTASTHFLSPTDTTHFFPKTVRSRIFVKFRIA